MTLYIVNNCLMALQCMHHKIGSLEYACSGFKFNTYCIKHVYNLKLCLVYGCSSALPTPSYPKIKNYG